MLTLGTLCNFLINLDNCKVSETNKSIFPLKIPSLRSTFIENLIFSVTLEGYLAILDARNGNILRMTNIFERIKKYEKRGLLADRTTVIPIGFIVSDKKIYISLSNGNLVSVDLLTGKSLDVVKIDGEKISRPYIFNNEMFVIRDNAILKLN